MGQYIQALLALGFVVGLIGVLSFILKYLSQNKIWLKRNENNTKTLDIIEMLPIDSKRRLVIIKRGDKKHLLLLGANEDLLVESFDE